MPEHSSGGGGSGGLFGGWAEGIIFVVAIAGVVLYLYSKYPTQVKEFFNTIKLNPKIHISPSPSVSISPTPVRVF